MIDLIRDQLPGDLVFGLSMSDIAGGGASSGGGWETMAVYLPGGDAREDRTVYFAQWGTIRAASPCGA